jgi:hypothetical protein
MNLVDYQDSYSHESELSSSPERIIPAQARTYFLAVFPDSRCDLLDRSLRPLALLLHSLATALNFVDYQDYYSREWSFLTSPEPTSPTSVSDQNATPLDLHALLRDMLLQPRSSEAGIHTVGQASGSGQAG